MPVVTEVESSVLRSLVQLWCAASNDGYSLPVKTRIDPVDLARIGIMPIVWLLERREDGELYCRLAGEDIVTAIGRATRGRKISDIYDKPSSELIIQQWDRILDKCETSHNKGVVVASQGRKYFGERLAMPLADDEGHPRFILGATYYKKLQGLFPVEEMVSLINDEPSVYTHFQTVLDSFDPPENMRDAG